MRNIRSHVSQALSTRVCTHFRAFRKHALIAFITVLGLTHTAGAQAPSQSVEFSAPFSSISQSSVTYGQGIVADAASNLYITGTVNLLYLQRNPDGTYTPASSKIDSVGGTAYGLAIDGANNLYRPDIAPGNSYPALAKYVYQGTNSFQKSSIGTWTSSNVLSSVAVDSNYNVYVLDAGASAATTGSIVELAPSSSCASVATCTTYTQTTLITDPRLHLTTGLSIDSNGNFYVASGRTTGNTGSTISNSTAAVYKVLPANGSYTIQAVGSSWNSPAATAIDSTGKVWVADYADQKIYELRPASSSPSETNYTKIAFQSSTTFTCLRTLTLSKTGQLFGLEAGGSGCNASAIPEVGGTAPHSLGTPTVNGSSTQEIDLTFGSPQNPVSYSVLTQGSTTGAFTDVTPSTGNSSSGAPYCTQGTGAGSTCAVVAQFTPSTPGVQQGALEVLDSNGTLIGTNYIYGNGYGSQAIFTPAQISTISMPPSTPGAIAVDGSNRLYVADLGTNRVYRVIGSTPTTILAGTGYPSTSADPICGGGAIGTNTNLTISGIAIDGAGLVYIADPIQNRVCSVNPVTGAMALVAGSGVTCSAPTSSCGDGGQAANAQLALTSNSGLAVDGRGNLLIADTADNRLRSVDLNSGVISTVAGTGTACSGNAACGDGGLANASGAFLGQPTGVVVNAAGDYLVADLLDQRIRKVSQLTNMLSTVAGAGVAGFSGDGGAATSAELSNPTGLAVDAAGDVYISDTGNNRIRLVLAGTQTITTLAGGGALLSGSNPTSALNGALSAPLGVALGPDGSVYIANTGQSVVEQLSSGTASLAFPTPTTVGTTDQTDGSQAVSLLNIGNLSLNSTQPGIIVPVDFTQLTGDSADCSSSFSLATGTLCNLRVQFTPQTTGSLSESLTINDNALGSASTAQTVALSGTAQPLAPIITLSPSSALASTTVGVTYAQTIAANGGTGPYTFAVTGGSLPGGLTLTNTGTLSGTPAMTGSFTFTITATDSSLVANGGPFTGSYTYTLSVAQGAASVTLSDLNQTYTGSPIGAVATTSPSGLAVTMTYNGGSTLPTAPGSYTIAATVSDSNYSGTANGTLVITPAAASITLSNLNQIYTGSPLTVLATTTPQALPVSITYNGSPTAPTAAGAYTIAATINDPNYTGTANGTLVIAKGAASVTLGNLGQTYTGSPLSAAASTTPSGLAVTLTYNGSPTAPTTAGTYTVAATINDPNYTGTANGALVIAKAQPILTWPSPAPITYSTPITSEQLNAHSNGVPGTFAYSPAAGTTLIAGSNQTLSVTFTPADTTNFTTASQTVAINIKQATTTASLSSDAVTAVVQNPVTLTATLTHAAAAPTGTVTFLDGATPLGSSSVSAGVAIFTTSALSPGTHTITAVYNGDSNYASAPGAAISENILDFAVTSNQNTTGTTGSTGAGNSTTLSQTVVPGGTASYTVSIAPTAGVTLPIATMLTVSGLPRDTTASLLTPGWTQVNNTSWSLPANATLHDVSLAFHLPGQSASVGGVSHSGRNLAPVALCLLMIPFSRRSRRLAKRINSTSCMLLALGALAISTLGLTGCGAQNGFFDQTQKAYVVTVTVTTGAVSHSTNLNLTVE